MENNIEALSRESIERIIEEKGGIETYDRETLGEMLFCAMLMATIDGQFHRKEWDSVLIFISERWDDEYGDAKEFVNSIVGKAKLMAKQRNQINQIISRINAKLKGRQKKLVVDLADLIMKADGKVLTSEADLLLRFRQQFGQSQWIENLSHLEQQITLKVENKALFDKETLKKAVYCAFLMSLIDSQLDERELEACSAFLDQHWKSQYGDKKKFVTEIIKDIQPIATNPYLINRKLDNLITEFIPPQKLAILNLAKIILIADRKVLVSEGVLFQRLKKALLEDLDKRQESSLERKVEEKSPAQIAELITQLFVDDEDEKPSRFKKTDQYVARIPTEFEESLESLTAYLVAPMQEDEEICRAIFYWIVSNVEYDVYAHHTTSTLLDETPPEKVLETKKALCYGSSRLFERLATLAGLEAVTVVGYAKDEEYKIGSSFKRPNHAWNYVKIEGQWKPIEVTWGAGNVVNKQFVRCVQDNYFLPAPEQFNLNHLPEDPKWQLLDNPISLEKFENMVMLYNPYFFYQMKVDTPERGTLNLKGNFKIQFEAPEHLVFKIELKDRYGVIPTFQHLIRIHRKKVWIEFSIPKKDLYYLNILCREKTQKEFRVCIAYKLRVTAGTKKPKYFPKLFDICYEKGIVLMSPLEGKLQLGQAYQFKINVPGANTVIIKMSWLKDVIELDKNGNEFVKEITVTQPNTLEIRARYGENENYLPIVRFKVEKPASLLD